MITPIAGLHPVSGVHSGCRALEIASAHASIVQVGRSRPRAVVLPGLQPGTAAGGTKRLAVRSVIADSWRRSVSWGLHPATIEPPYDSDEDDGTIDTSGAEVVASIAGDLAGTTSALVLADDRGRIVRRSVADRSLREELDRVRIDHGFLWTEHHVGTSAIGTTLHARSATFVAGDEHFADAFRGICGAGAPVVMPQSGRLAGVVAVIRFAHDATDLMTTLACRAAREIEQRLGSLQSARDDWLQHCFVRARRHTRGAMVLVGPDTLLTNAAASRLVTPADRTAIWEWAQRASARRLGNERQTSAPLALPSGRCVVATCDPVWDRGAIVAAVVTLAPAGTATPEGAPHTRPVGSQPQRFGWGSLTPTELAIAERAGSGETNREIASHLFMSRHTIDTHIRHIYNKLGIASRIELARFVLAATDDQSLRPLG